MNGYLQLRLLIVACGNLWSSASLHLTGAFFVARRVFFIHEKTKAVTAVVGLLYYQIKKYYRCSCDSSQFAARSPRKVVLQQYVAVSSACMTRKKMTFHTLMPRGWKPELVKSLLTVPDVSRPVRWSCFCTTSTEVPGETFALADTQKHKIK